MSDFYNKYPYTDFHELNLDWVIERVKKLTEDWLTTQEAWNNTQEQWQQLHDYVMDYFANLDLQDEVNTKIQSMIANGTFSTLMQPIISDQISSMNLPGYITQWLDDNVTPVGSAVVVDNSLSIQGAAADAKVTGDNFNVMGLILDNLVTPETDVKTISVISGSANIFASNQFTVYNDRDYFLYCKVKITGLATWYSGYMYTRLLFGIDAGGWNGTQITSISDQGEYVMAYNLRPASSGSVKLNLYFNNQDPTTNSFQVQILKAFVVESSEDLRAFFDDQAQADKVLIRLYIPNKTVHNYMLADDAFSPVTDTTIIDCWGDSLTQGAGSGSPEHPYTERLQTLIGNTVVVNNYGQGSETAESIAFRQGGLNAMVQPFTAAAVGQYAQIPILTSLDSVPLSELSISGRYLGNNSVNIGGYDFIYRRINSTTSQVATLDAGAAGHVFTRPEIVYAGGKGVKHIMLVCMGQNGYGRSDLQNSPEFLADLHQLMIDHNNSDYYMVLGIPTGNLNTMKECESILASRFGSKFVNLREYISAYGLSDNNITPTTADTDAMAIGAIPPSLKADTVHMNQAGYIAMANCIYERGKTLGYW